MPPLYVLNPPVNPFWDFVAGLEDHPMFQIPPGNERRPQQPQTEAPQQTAWGSKRNEEATAEMSEKAQGKQATVEDPPEVDPATVEAEKSRSGDAKDRFRRRGRWARDGDEGSEGERRCRGGRHRGPPGGFGWGGPPPFSPFFGRQSWFDQAARPEHPHGPPHGPPRDLPHHGPPPHGPPHHGPGRHGPPPHSRDHHHHRRGPPGPPRDGFDLSQFLNRLGERLGVDLAGAAEGFGLTADRFTAGRANQEVDFEPRSDIFENKDLYTVHLSLPGAKKSDIGVDYDGEHSVLRVTGVVHRPDVDEAMLNELVVDGRKRETGVFEKAIRLGTKRDPASIDVSGIIAKMADGVLVVKIPKIAKIVEKREVPITTDPVDAGHADYEDEYSEKPILFDADEHGSTAGTDVGQGEKRGPISLIDQEDVELTTNKDEKKNMSKKREADEVKATASVQTAAEQLPAYSAKDEHEEEDWENFSEASGEGEYVKIDVK